MQSSFASQNQINAGDRIPPYTIVSFSNKNYRILTKQYVGFICMLKCWAVFWYSLSFCSLASATVIYFDLPIFIILTFAQVSCIGFTISLFINRRQVSKGIYYSAINLTIFLIPIIVLAVLEIQQIVFPTIIYITIQLILALAYLKNRGHVMLKLLFLLQILLITLKADNKIHSQWKQILISSVIFQLFLGICLFFMTFYIVYIFVKAKNQSMLTQKKAGALFIYFNVFGFCCICAVPLLNIILFIRFQVCCVLATACFLLLATYIVFNQKQIVIFFCTLNEIKSFDQIISFQEIQGVSEQNLKSKTKSKDKAKQINQKMKLFKISENWLTDKPQKALIIKQNNPQSDTQQKIKNSTTDCLICLDKKAEMVWMPCGHLTVCIQCFTSMYNNKNVNCLLCKKIPEQVFLIQVDKTKQHDQISINNQNLKSSTEQIKSNPVQRQDYKIKKLKISNRLINALSPSKNKQFQQEKVVFSILQGYNVKVI